MRQHLLIIMTFLLITSVNSEGQESLLVSDTLKLGFGVVDCGSYQPALSAIQDTAVEYQKKGVEHNLPIFYRGLKERITYRDAWDSSSYDSFSQWRVKARSRVIESLLYAPPGVPFNPEIIAEEDRGSYIARKIVFNISADSRVLAYMLIPKGQGPFPAVLLLHDHGARFDIGKEKVIKPFGIPDAKAASAQEWVENSYGGRFIGDELAKRGYVCLASDMLNWSDRGGDGDRMERYHAQQAIASNLMFMGASLAGLIAYEDMRAAEFLSQAKEVDSKAVAAMGLSVGSYRAWQVAALSDHVKAGVAVCWMASLKGLLIPHNNITGGNSAFTMLHPELFNYLDIPDVASIACPKPMLFYNGLRDGLFPVPAVKEAYQKMHTVWASQKADSLLVTKLWDTKHLFNEDMQEEAFGWLDRQLKENK